ncbi:MAG: S9 family peptidase [Bacteroidota bacterium]|jgi:dipeptidyl aminopeptidase/acylaminoacyl peptidase
MSRFRIVIVFLFLAVALQAQTEIERFEVIPDAPKHVFTFEDMYRMGRVSDPRIAPDGESVLYVVTYYSLETNKSNSDIWKVDIEGKSSVQLTTSPGGDSHPRWSPDGTGIAFVSARENGSQIWMMNPDGTQQRRISNISTGIDAFEWTPTGTHFLYSSSVYPDCKDDACNRVRDEEKEKNPVKARLINKLPYRVWMSWKDDKYSHVFVLPSAGGIPRDITPGPYDTPPIDIGGAQDFVASPDGKEVAFVKNTDAMVAASTNNDVWLVGLDGSNARCITTGNKGNDNQPVYSPDGRYIAFRSMARAGYEADKYDLKVYDRTNGKTTLLTEGVDRSVEEVVWTKDGKRLLFTAQDGTYKSLFEVPAAGGDVLRVIKGMLELQYAHKDTVQTIELGTYRHDFRLHPDGERLVFLGERQNYPTEIMSIRYDGKRLSDIRQITKTNTSLIDSIAMPEPEIFTFKSFDGAEVQGWIIVPPDFDVKKKYPMIYLVHGGPQGVWADNFHYRWNTALFAAPGFVIVTVNCRGSQGFGQAFTDGVNGDWGGAPYKDLMTGLDFVLKKYPFIDKDRVGAAGASYGGYMMNWFLGNTKRFKAIFSHDGVYDLMSMYGGTEELWFTEWEFKGTPWTNQKMYDKWSPSRKAANFKTPTYVVHGQLDFRVPVEQGMQLFTALQRQGVESKFLYFPDEGHLVLKPRNAQLWYSEFHAWFKKHLMP